MHSILDSEHSDLVVLNGDLITCEYVAPSDVNGIIDQIVFPIVNRNLPFAVTFGNHDASKTCNTDAMTGYMWDNLKGRNGQRLSFATKSVPGSPAQVGVSNYYIPIYSANDDSRLAMLLWFFDSRGGRVFQPGGADVPVGNWVDEQVSHPFFHWVYQSNLKL